MPVARWRDDPRPLLNIFGGLRLSTNGYSIRALAAIGLGLAALWVPVLALHLAPAFFAALGIYAATLGLAAWIRSRWPTFAHAEGLALAVILVLLVVTLGLLLGYASASRANWPELLHRLSVVLHEQRATLPAWLVPWVPPSVDALQDEVVHWLRSHATDLRLWGGHTLRGFGYVLAGIVIGALMSMQIPRARSIQDASDSFPAQARRRFDDLVKCFSNVVFAQVRIAAINGVLTAVFLLALLPAVGRPLPMAGTLVALTFFAGLIPIVGNLVSNTAIVVIALGVSWVDATLALAWLVSLHKLEYFLNAYIVGSRIRARAWELLIAMLLMEALFGLAGLISAPILYAQFKLELHRRGWLV